MCLFFIASYKFISSLCNRDFFAHVFIFIMQARRFLRMCFFNFIFYERARRAILASKRTRGCESSIPNEQAWNASKSIPNEQAWNASKSIPNEQDWNASKSIPNEQDWNAS